MNKFDEARKEYENIPIPVELGDRVQEGIRQGRTARRTRLRHRRMWLSAAACFTVLAVSRTFPRQLPMPPPMCRFWADCSKF